MKTLKMKPKIDFDCPICLIPNSFYLDDDSIVICDKCTFSFSLPLYRDYRTLGATHTEALLESHDIVSINDFYEYEQEEKPL